MDISAAVLITNGKEFLVCHPTDAPYTRSWSLPKGLVDKGESDSQAAVREVKEETGIIVVESLLKDLGIFDYRLSKKIHIFLYEVENINVSMCRCDSMFTAHNGHIKPEVDKFAWIKFEKAQSYLNPNLWKIMKNILLEV